MPRVLRHLSGADAAARVRHLIVLEHGGLAGIRLAARLLAADLDEKAKRSRSLNAYVHYIPANLQKAKT